MHQQLQVQEDSLHLSSSSFSSWKAGISRIHPPAGGGTTERGTAAKEPVPPPERSRHACQGENPPTVTVTICESTTEWGGHISESLQVHCILNDLPFIPPLPFLSRQRIYLSIHGGICAPMKWLPGGKMGGISAPSVVKPKQSCCWILYLLLWWNLEVEHDWDFFSLEIFL